MDDLKAALLGGDPVARERPLSVDAAGAMRRAVVAAADAIEPGGASWPRPVFVAATVAATILVGVALGVGLPRAGHRAPSPPAQSARVDGGAPLEERRQLQFATPGGTRIIWVFDPEFNP